MMLLEYNNAFMPSDPGMGLQRLSVGDGLPDAVGIQQRFYAERSEDGLAATFYGIDPT